MSFETSMEARANSYSDLRDESFDTEESITMRATIAAIESKTSFTDGQRRFTLRFDGVHSEIRIPENRLGIVGLELDDQLEVSFRPLREEAKFEAA